MTGLTVSLLLSEARTLPGTQDPPSKSGPTLLFWLSLRLPFFTGSTLQHNGIRCSPGNILFFSTSCLYPIPGRGSFSSPFTTHQNYSCTVLSLNFPQPCCNKLDVISPLAKCTLHFLFSSDILGRAIHVYEFASHLPLHWMISHCLYLHYSA